MAGKREFDPENVMKIAAENWAGVGKKFDAGVVKALYEEVTQFTCFTSIKVQILTQKALVGAQALQLCAEQSHVS
jgi:hypothetical protein